MDVEIVSFKLVKCPLKVGCIVIRYHQLQLKLDLVYNPKFKKAWVRMPEKWISKEKKFSYICWPDKAVSDQFQKTVLELIYSQNSLDDEKIRIFFEENKKKTKRNFL